MNGSSKILHPDTLLLDALARPHGNIAFGIGLGDLIISGSSSSVRPTLPTACLFTSTLSGSSTSASSGVAFSAVSSGSSCSSTLPQAKQPTKPAPRRPVLTPEALYAHAFGLEAWEKKVQKERARKESQKAKANIDAGSQTRRTSVALFSALSQRRLSSPIAGCPSPLPLGTFKSVNPTRPLSVLGDTRTISSSAPPTPVPFEFPVSGTPSPAQDADEDDAESVADENSALRADNSSSEEDPSTTTPEPFTPESSSKPTFKTIPYVPYNSYNSPTGQHEPPMSPTEWRKKSHERLNRRALVLGLGPKGSKGKGKKAVAQIPFNIQC